MAKVAKVAKKTCMGILATLMATFDLRSLISDRWKIWALVVSAPSGGAPATASAPP